MKLGDILRKTDMIDIIKIGNRQNGVTKPTMIVLED